MDADRLLGGAEGIFDGPSPGIGSDNLARWHVAVGADEEVIMLMSVRVPADDQKDGPLGYRIPQDDSGMDELGDTSSPAVSDDARPCPGPGGDLGWRAQSLPFLPWSAALA